VESGRRHIKVSSRLKKFWTDLLHVPEPDPPPAAVDDTTHHIRRLHPRHGPLYGAVSFHLEGYAPINVANLSVGGLLLTDISQDVSGYCTNHAETTGYLSIVNDRRPITVSIVSISNHAVNCRIMHDDQSTILWMIPYLNLLRQGTQLKRNPKQPEKYQAGGLSVTAGAAGLTIESLSPPFAVPISTSRPLVAPDREADRHALRLCLFVLFGFIECPVPITASTLAERAIAMILGALAEERLSVGAAG